MNLPERVKSDLRHVSMVDVPTTSSLGTVRASIITNVWAQNEEPGSLARAGGGGGGGAGGGGTRSGT